MYVDFDKGICRYENGDYVYVDYLKRSVMIFQINTQTFNPDTREITISFIDAANISYTTTVELSSRMNSKPEKINGNTTVEATCMFCGQTETKTFKDLDDILNILQLRAHSFKFNKPHDFDMVFERCLDPIKEKIPMMIYIKAIQPNNSMLCCKTCSYTSPYKK